MQVTIFGATGGIGSELVKQSLAEGWRVRVLVRNAAKLGNSRADLDVTVGDVLDPAAVAAAIGRDTHAVFSALGASGAERHVTVFSGGVRNIIAAMEAVGTPRFLGVSAAALHIDRYDALFLKIAKAALQRMFRANFDDLRRMEAVVQKTQLAWTLVVPPRLMNAPFTGTYRTALDHNLARGFSIARADVAHCMLRAVHEKNTFGRMLFIAS